MAVALQVGCSWLFQDTLPDRYSGRSEPACTTGSGWAVVDTVFAAANGLSALAYAVDDTAAYREAYIVSGIAWTLIHAASAGSGFKHAAKCRKAVAAWNEGGSERDESDEEERLRLKRDIAREEARERARERVVPVQPPPPPPPRGFYCAASTASVAAAVCARHKSACTQGRNIAIGAVPDLSECTLVETAWCFDAGSGNELERCAPTEDGCMAQREATLLVTAGACTEQP